jgi:hypothetical protein
MNESRAEELLLALQSASFGPEWWSYVLVAIVSSVGGFLGAYLRKRGELLAQKEDFERILNEQRQTTKELERIRDEITQAAWHRSQVWTQR